RRGTRLRRRWIPDNSSITATRSSSIRVIPIRHRTVPISSSTASPVSSDRTGVPRSRASRRRSGGLAAGAGEGGSLPLHDTSDRPAALSAGLARAVVDQELISIGPGLVPDRAIRAEGRPHPLDRVAQDAHRLAVHGFPLAWLQAASAAPRVDARAVQDLARIDVAHTGE